MTALRDKQIHFQTNTQLNNVGQLLLAEFNRNIYIKVYHFPVPSENGWNEKSKE